MSSAEPDQWRLCEDCNGRTYYYRGDETTWICPDSFIDTSPASSSAHSTHSSNASQTKNTSEIVESKSSEDESWEAFLDPKTKVTYYYNSQTRETSWIKPENFKQITETSAQEQATDPHQQSNQIQKPGNKQTHENRNLKSENVERRPSLSSSRSGSWRQAIDVDTQRPYYYHAKRRMSAWELPIGGAEETNGSIVNSDVDSVEPDLNITANTSQASLWLECVDEVSGATIFRASDGISISKHRPTSEGSQVWAQYTDVKTSNVYYANAISEETRWTCPPALTSLITSLGRANRSTSTPPTQNVENTPTSETSNARHGRHTESVDERQNIGSIETIAPANADHLSDSVAITPTVSPSKQTNDHKTKESTDETELNRHDKHYNNTEKYKNDNQLGIDTTEAENIRESRDSPMSTSSATSSPRRRLSSLWSVRTSESVSGASSPRRPVSKREGPAPVVEGYINKQGGGTRLFGRQNWRRRYVVVTINGVLGVFRSKAEFDSGAVPIKNRWVDLSHFRLEEVLKEELGFRLMPAEKMSCEQRVWNLLAESAEQKQEWLAALMLYVSARGFVKSLDRALSSLKESRPDLQ